MFGRITADPTQMGGVPCIRGLQIPVATIVAMVADEMSHDEILQAYPDLEREDIHQALRFAAEAVDERQTPTVEPEPRPTCAAAAWCSESANSA